MSYSPPEDDATEQLEVGTANLIFCVLYKNVVIIDKAPWENPALTTPFS